MKPTSTAVHAILKWPLLALLACPVQVLAEGVAITGGTVITMTDAGVLRDQTILVRGDEIVSMGPSESTVVPEGFERLDAMGRFVLPGFVDMHVHLSGRADLLANLRYGVTSVLQMSGQRGQIADFLGLRDQIEDGEIVGPRLFLTGPMFDRLGLSSQASAYAVEETSQIAGVLKAHIDAGYDFVKVHNFTPAEVYRTLVGSSTIPVVGHIPMRVPLDEVLSSGQAMFAHASLFYYNAFFDPSCRDGFWQCMAQVQPDMSVLDELVDRIAESGTTVTANLSILAAEQSNDDDWHAVLEDDEFALLDRAMQERWRVDNPLHRELRRERRKDIDNQVEFVYELVARLSARGVPLLAGTDAGVEGLFPGRALHLELQQLVAAGLSEVDALKAATATPGRFLREYVPRSKKLGSIQKGYVADLVVLDANPLEDIRNTLRVWGTMSRGTWHASDSRRPYTPRMSEAESVKGASVWRSDELANHPDLQLNLADGELAELATLARGPEIVARPRLEALGARLRQRLEDGPGIVRLRGLQPDDHGEEGLSRMLLAFSETLGTPVSQNVVGDRIFRVADAGLQAGDPRSRGPVSRNALTFHSDRADVIGFLCVRPAAEGGESIVVSAGAIHNQIAETRPDLLAELYRPFCWQRHNIDTANERPWYEMPIFSREGGQFAITLMQVLIERAHRNDDLPDLTSAQRDALELIQELAGDPGFQLRFRQEAGELLLLNNYVTLHSRTAFSDPPGSAGRLLLRVWISVPNSRPLPESWAAHYGEHLAGAVRGGIREQA